MRLVLLVLLLAGCFGSPEQVGIAVDNRTDEARDFEIVVWWDDGGEPVQRGTASGTIEAGQQERLFELPRPCDEGLAGTLVYVGALDNGTSVVWEQEWPEGTCVEQDVTLVIDEQVRFEAV